MTDDCWFVSWKTWTEEAGEEFHEKGFPFHGDAVDFRDELERNNSDAYDITIYDI